MNTQSFSTRRLPDGCDHQDLQHIGDFSWRYLEGEVAGMIILLPLEDGTPTPSWQPVTRGAPQHIDGSNTWGWDGNLDNPTLEPSILLRPNHWHGYLRAGRLESC